MKISARNFCICVLISMLIAPPTAFGGGVAPDPAAAPGKRPGLDAAQNGVPIVNITTPNSSGLSHNQYKEFNVATPGLILNNSEKAVSTQLGGIIAGNANLPGSGPASAILNEVTGGSRSSIEGHIEVAGQRADVILANPNGVTINGGGFINTNRAVVGTGAPVLDASGALRALDVRGGDVRVEGAGINAANITAFDIVSRAAEINADIHAQNLSIVTGQNEYDMATGRATPHAPDGSAAPSVAIDARALGGMYAGRVVLTSTEKGVGVNLEGLVQSQGDLLITADGRLTVNGASASLAAGRDMTLTAGTLDMTGIQAAAQGTVDVRAGAVTLDSSSLYAGNGLRAQADSLRAEASDVTAEGDLDFSGGGLELTGSGLSAGGDISVRGASLQGESATLFAGGLLSLEFSGDAATGQNSLLYGHTGLELRLDGDFSNSVNSVLLSGGDLSISGLSGARASSMDNYGGLIESMNGNLRIAAQSISNRATPTVVEQFMTDYEYFQHNIYVSKPFLADGRPNLAPASARTGGSGKTNRQFETNVRFGLTSSYDDTFDRPYDGRILQEWIIFKEDRIVSAGTPGVIQAAGALYLEGDDILNRESHMAAGGDISIRALNFTNTGLELSDHVNIVRRYYQISNSGSFYGSGPFDRNYLLSEVTSAVPATVRAGGTLDIAVDNELENAAEKALGVDYLGTSASNIFGQIGGSLEALATGGESVPLLPPGMGSLFSWSEAPEGRYLIESRHGLTNFGDFYGSEYFLSRMGYDLDAENMKLMGDAWFEMRYVQSQILEQTGGRYLMPGLDDAATLLALMDNAAEFGQSLGLSVGVSLTAEQIGQLGSDIVWLEEREVNGQKALVPVLYLCQTTLDGTGGARGAVLAGAEVNIEAGSVNNSGAIRADQTLTVASSGDILNRGGELSGRLVVLDAEGGIISRSGTLKGEELRLAAGEDIRLETHSGAETGLFGSLVHQVSQVLAGSFEAVAGRDISLQGASVNVEREASLVAGRDVSLTAGTYQADMTAPNTGYSATRHFGSVLEAGDVNVTAGRDIAVAGSALLAENNAALTAGHDISVISVMDSLHYKGGTSGNKREDYATANSASVIGAGNDLTLVAGADAARGKGHITVVGSVLEAGLRLAEDASLTGDLRLAATGDVALTHATEDYYHMTFKSKKGFLSASSTLRESGGSTSVGSCLSGNNVSILAGDNVLISGSGVNAAKDLSIAAQTGDIIVSAAQDSWWSRVEKKKSKFNLGQILSAPLLTATFQDAVFFEAVSEKGRQGGTSNVGSVLGAGNDLSLYAGRDVSLIGSAAVAGNDVFMEAVRDVNLLPGRENYYSEYSKSKTQAGLWTSLSEGGFSLFAGVKHEEQGVSRTGDYTAGSLVSAGNDVVIGAGRDVTQVASHIEAGRDAVIDAGQDWNMLAGMDYETLHQYVKTVQAGISASVSQNVSGAVRTLIDLPENATAGKGNVGFRGITAASAGLRAAQSLQAAAQNTVSASASVGASFSKSEYSAWSNQAQGSSVSAGRDVVAKAVQDVSIEGGQIYGGRGVLLDAGRDVTITSSLNDGGSKFDSSSGGASVGVKAVIGSGGFSAGIDVAANAAGAGAKDKYTSHNNANIVAGDLLSITSGRDTAVAGAHLEGERVWMDVGGDLTVASLQNHYDGKSSNWSAGADVTVGYGVNVSVTLGYGMGKSDSDWVGQQTSIVGRSEVDIYTEGNTHIEGAIIATDPGGDLILNTGTLTYAEIKDKDTSSSWSADLSASVSFEGGFDNEAFVEQTPWGPLNPMDFTSPGTGGNKEYTPDSLGGQYSSSDTRGILRPTVTEGLIIVRDGSDADLSGLSRDLDRSREVTRDEKSYADVYIPPQVIAGLLEGTILKEHDKDAEKYNHVANFFPGLFINESITGQESHKTDKYLRFDFDEYDNRIPVEGVVFLASDQNPFFQLLYHVVPGVKSYSEIHDVQMKLYEKKYEESPPTFVTMITIPTSFAQSFINSLTLALDVADWKGNWEDHIKTSFQSRYEKREVKK